MFTRSLLAVALVIGVLAAAETAGAHKINYKTKVSITGGGPTGATGRLSCTTRGCPTPCRSNRTITLFLGKEGPDQLMGTGRTKADGSWAISAQLTAGDYYVVAAGKKLPAAPTHRHICAFAVSQIKHL